MSGSYQFKILEFQGLLLKTLRFELHDSRFSRDKIIGVNTHGICIRNNGKLLFGSSQLRAKNLEMMTSKTTSLSLHKHILLSGYSFEFFTPETAYYLLKTNRAQCLYQLLLNAKSQFNNTKENNVERTSSSRKSFAGIIKDTRRTYSGKKSSSLLELEIEEIQTPSIILSSRPDEQFCVSFRPYSLEKVLATSFNEFLRINNFASEDSFRELLEQMMTELTPENSTSDFRTTASETIYAMTELKAQAQSIDIPSKFILLEAMSNRTRSECRLTSEIIICATLSEQQSFVLRTLLNKEPENWDEAKKVGMIYWFEDLALLKQIIEKGALEAYRNSKDPFSFLFWFVLFGKTKALAGLFKLAPDQQRLAKFFAEDFSKQEFRDKAANNAFSLKSKKRYLYCVAFFILAKKYSEAFEIIVETLKDLQLVTLVFRVCEREIREQSESYSTFENLILDKFIAKGEAINDPFLQAIGHKLLGNKTEIINSLRNFKASEFSSQDVDSLRESLGFAQTLYPLSLPNLLEFLSVNPHYARFFNNTHATISVAQAEQNAMTAFWQDEDEQQELSHEAHASESSIPDEKAERLIRVEERFNFHTENQNYFLALLELVELRAISSSSFDDITQRNRHRVKYNIVQIAFRKLSRLLGEEGYLNISHTLQEIRRLAEYFKLPKDGIIRKVTERIELINDDCLTIAFLEAVGSTDKISDFLTISLTKSINKTQKLLKKNPFVFRGSRFWMKSLLFLLKSSRFMKVASMLESPSDKNQILSNTFAAFSEAANALLRVVLINSGCYTEINKLLSVQIELPVMCSEFESLVLVAIEKVKKLHPFSLDSSCEDSITNSSLRGDGAVQPVELLTISGNEDFDRIQHSLFIKMNRQNVGSRKNNVIVDLGLSNYFTPANLCLQVLTKVIMLNEMLQHRLDNERISIVKISITLSRVINTLLQHFLFLIQQFDLDDAQGLLDELRTVIFADVTSVKRQAFHHIAPSEALAMNFNDRVFGNYMSLKTWSSFLEDSKVFELLRRPTSSISEDLRQKRKALFRGGIQIFRPKLEGRFFKRKNFHRMIPFSHQNGEELFIWVQKRLRKVLLFTSLFKKPRSADFFTLTSEVI